MIIQGQGSKEVSKRVAEKMNTSLSNAVRLVHTEHGYVMEQATQKAYIECDVDKYEILATLDKRTSEICQRLDGEVVNVKDAVVGVNMPPFHWHPFCRTTTIPYIEDDYSTRFARDKEGKAIEVRSSMKYKQWKKEFGID